VAGAAIALIALAITLLLLGEFAISRALIPAGSTSLVAWVIGDYMRSRRQFFAELVSRNQAAREQAAEEERLRIARELHDVVAHNVSVMAIQAGAARLSGSSTQQALQSIETTARDTLSELNRLLGVLRKQPAAPLAPQPGLDQVEALLKTARDAGLEAALVSRVERLPRVSGGSQPMANRQLLAVLDAAGEGEHFAPGLGHGVGLEVHEPPRLSRTDCGPPPVAGSMSASCCVSRRYPI